MTKSTIAVAGNASLPNQPTPSPRLVFGLGKERASVMASLTMLISSGLPINSALEAIQQDVRSGRMRSILTAVRQEVESGSPLWRALAASGLFPDHAISLIRLGEQSGKLRENLRLAAAEQEKNLQFRSKLRSAMLYPVFVLGLTAVIGVGIAWFILPKLATVFAQLRMDLPLITRILIRVGAWLGRYGLYALPAAAGVVLAALYFLFSYPKTKAAGQALLSTLPGIKQLLQEVELARFGYLLGTLLEAGLPVNQALDALSAATDDRRYRRLYDQVNRSIQDGNSFQKSFAAYRHINQLVPVPIQQLVVAAEKSGRLAPTLLKIGQLFEERSDTTTKNLTVILEPVLLVIVWLGVVAVALAVILPIYNLVGGLNTS